MGSLIIRSLIIGSLIIIRAKNDYFIDNLSDKSIIVSKSYRNRTIIGIEIDRESIGNRMIYYPLGIRNGLGSMDSIGS